MVGETPDEPVEGPTVRQDAEATEGAETRFVLQPANQRVGVGQIQDKGGDVGSPEGLERVSLPASQPVLLKAGQQGRVVQAGENGGKLAKVVCSRS